MADEKTTIKKELLPDWEYTRLPTEEDANPAGQVIVSYSGGGTYKSWEAVSKKDFWFDPKLYNVSWDEVKIVSPAECLARKLKGDGLQLEPPPSTEHEMEIREEGNSRHPIPPEPPEEPSTDHPVTLRREDDTEGKNIKVI